MDLAASCFEIGQEDFEVLKGYRADVVPDNDPGNDLLAHSVGGPVVLPTPAEEAMIGLRPDAPFWTFSPKLLSEAVCRREDEGAPEEFYTLGRLAATAAAVEVGQSAGRNRVFIWSLPHHIFRSSGWAQAWTMRARPRKGSFLPCRAIGRAEPSLLSQPVLLLFRRLVQVQTLRIRL